MTVAYPDGTLALDSVSLEAGGGEIVVVAGPNGGGKTTLLELIAGLIPHVVEAWVEGSVRVYGVDPTRDPAGAAFHVQLALQDPRAQVLGSTVIHEASLTLLLRGRPQGEALEKARRALAAVGLEGLEDRPTHRLSTGQLARAALAGTLAPEPSHLLLDEPTSHLDPQAAESLLSILRGLAREGHGILAASHDPRLWAIADECYTLARRIRPGCPREPPAPSRRSRGGGGRRVLALEGVWARYPGSLSLIHI